MAKVDYNALAPFIVENVGGKENIVSLTHCVTRLRFRLKDESKTNTTALKEKNGILDVIQKGGQYQVVIGNAVEDAYDAVLKLGGIGAGGEVEAENTNTNQKLFESVCVNDFRHFYSTAWSDVRLWHPERFECFSWCTGRDQHIVRHLCGHQCYWRYYFLLLSGIYRFYRRREVWYESFCRRSCWCRSPASQYFSPSIQRSAVFGSRRHTI